MNTALTVKLPINIIPPLCTLNWCGMSILINGAVAQLGERHVRNVEVVGSIPIGSTNLLKESSILEGR